MMLPEAGHTESRLRQPILRLVEDIQEVGAKFEAGALGERDAADDLPNLNG